MRVTCKTFKFERKTEALPITWRPTITGGVYSANKRHKRLESLKRPYILLRGVGSTPGRSEPATRCRLSTSKSRRRRDARQLTSRPCSSVPPLPNRGTVAVSYMEWLVPFESCAKRNIEKVAVPRLNCFMWRRGAPKIGLVPPPTNHNSWSQLPGHYSFPALLRGT